jgi:FAD/FMN-containing dehydrogenase
MKLFNQLYYHKQFQKISKSSIHYNPFFYPLDSVNNWNRLYGPNGFVQFQFVIARQNSLEIIDKCLTIINKHKTGSSLSVLKIFGNITSPGMLSFPRPGLTLAMDFPYEINKTPRFLDEISDIIKESGGASYPAKDTHMSKDQFQQAYPAYQNFTKYIDTKFDSNFWRRVNG